MVAQFVDSNVSQAKPSGSAFSRNLSVTVGSGDALDVRHFHVIEKMSTIFEVKLVAVCENHDIDFEGVVGQSASFTVQERSTSTWTGVCNHFQQVGVEEGGLSTYELTLVPKLWLLTQRRNHRMFQLMSEVDIVQRLLGEWGIDFDMRLSGSYKKRKYKVQYGETDETFIRRLLEEVGVSFYFEEGKLVLDDGPQRNGSRGAIPFRDKPTVADREHVTAVCVGRRLRPGKVTLRDHDYRKQPDYKLMTTVSGGSGVETQMESFHYLPGAFLFDGPGGDTPMADFRGPYRTSEGEGTSLAQKRLDGARASAKTVSFKTNAHDLSPGRVLSVVDHPKRDVAGKPLLVTESRFSGTHDGEWAHEVTAASADAPYRPEVITPTPMTSGVESATVVGPPGEEIHVDEFGRVQVHFHWDRESQMNEQSSCWIHVVQPWSGTGFGGTALPRVGQEVIVDFLDGNPDRPVIIGRVYTNLEKTPYKLPDNKTQTGIKTNSTHNTGGYNELMFEDLAGNELLRMQAEKDLKKLVKNDEEVKIGRDREKKIGRDDSHDVGRDRQRTVGRDESVQVGQDRTRQVGRDESVTIGQDRTKSVQRDEMVSIGQDRKKRVENDEMISIGNNQQKMVENDEMAMVKNDRMRMVQNDEMVAIGNNMSKYVHMDENHTVGQNRTKFVQASEFATIGQDFIHTVMANAREMTGMSKHVMVGVNRSTHVGMIDAKTVGETHVVMISPPGEQGVPGGSTFWNMENWGHEIKTAAGGKVTLKENTIVLDSGPGPTIKLNSVEPRPPPPPLKPSPPIKEIILDSGLGATIVMNESIKLTVGGNSITIDSGGVTIVGAPIKLNC